MLSRRCRCLIRELSCSLQPLAEQPHRVSWQQHVPAVARTSGVASQQEQHRDAVDANVRCTRKPQTPVSTALSSQPPRQPTPVTSVLLRIMRVVFMYSCIGSGPISYSFRSCTVTRLARVATVSTVSSNANPWTHRRNIISSCQRSFVGNKLRIESFGMWLCIVVEGWCL